MTIHTQIQQFILKHHLVKDNHKIVVGLSGGPDSVFLVHFLASLQKEYNLSLIAAHLNHEWRVEAEQEQQDCADLAHKLGIPFVTKKRSELTAVFKHNGSQEEYGRRLRRHFFEQILCEYNADSVALAHHAQDQEETFFIRLIRGSSLTGLTSIKPKNGPYIRPLLETPKAEILAWLHTNNIPYALDKTNESPDYLRNRIRLNVLPALRICDERFEANFLTTLNRLKTTEDFLERLTQKAFEKITTKHIAKNNIAHSESSSLCARPELVEGYPRALKETLQQVQGEREGIRKSEKLNGLYCIINIPDFLKLDPALHHRILLHWLITENVQFPTTQAFLDEIMRFLSTPNGGHHSIHEQWSLIKKQNFAFLMKK